MKTHFKEKEKTKIKSIQNLPIFYDENSDHFNITDEMRVAPHLGEEVDAPKINFTLVEQCFDNRIRDLNKRLYDYVKVFDTEKKNYDDMKTDVFGEIDTLEKDLYFRVKGNFETLADDINEQKSLNLLNQKQITNLKKEKNEQILEMNNYHRRLDNIEKTLGIDIKAKREKIEKK